MFNKVFDQFKMTHIFLTALFVAVFVWLIMLLPSCGFEHMCVVVVVMVVVVVVVVVTVVMCGHLCRYHDYTWTLFKL